MSMRELEVTGAFKGVRCQLDERGVSGVLKCPAFPGLSLRVCIDKLSFTCAHKYAHFKHTLYMLFLMFFVHCRVVCMCALYLCMHVSAVKNHSSLLSTWFFWNRISQSNPELTDKPSLVSQLALGISYLQFLTLLPCRPSIYIDSGDPNSGLHAYMINALSMGLSPQTSIYLF